MSNKIFQCAIASPAASGSSASPELAMCFSGMVATIGLATGALHLVTGAKLIAPGFEVIARIGIGLVTGHFSLA